MEITLNFWNLGIIALFCLFATVCIFLIITLVNANKVIKKIDGIAERNINNIDEVLAQLPDFSKNVNRIAVGLGYGIDSIGSVVGLVDNALIRTISALGAGTGTIMDVVSAIRNRVTRIRGKTAAKKR
jgi:cytolysin (calcineurin-like family phosphatase)